MRTVGLGGAVEERTPSETLWRGFPVEDVQEGVRNGYFRHWEFGEIKASANVNASVAAWGDGLNLYGSDGAVVAVLDEVGGGKTFSSDGDNEGVAFQQIALPFQISRSHGLSVFECRLKTSTITDTKHGFFWGLGDAMTLSATVPIAAAGTLADENFVGFHRLEGDGDQLDTVYKAATVTQVTVKADAYTLVADTYVKLGMRFEPKNDRSGNYYLSFWVDGVRLADDKQIPSASGTDFPNHVRMGLLFALLNATASTPGSTSIQWMRGGQLYDGF